MKPHTWKFAHRATVLNPVRGAGCAIAVILIAATAGAAEVARQVDGNIVTESIPPIPAAVGERLRQYQNTRAAGLIGWLPATAAGQDDSIIIATRFGETTQLHRVDRPGGARAQLTFFDEPVGAAAVAPDGSGVLIQKDVGGNEFYQIYFLDLATGRTRLLTDGESRNGAALWAGDASRIAYYTTARNGRDWDIYLTSPDAAAEPPRALLQQDGTWFPIDFAADGEHLLVARYISINESRLYSIDVLTGLSRPVAASETPVSFGVARFDAGGRVFMTSDAGSDVRRLRVFDPITGGEQVLSGDIDWDVTGVVFDHARRQLAFTTNEDGISRLYLLDAETLERRRVDAIPLGTIDDMAFDPAGERLALQINTSTSPSDIHVLDLATLTMERWTYSEVGGLDSSRFVTPQLVRFPTFDSAEGGPPSIPAFYYRPPGDGPFPVLISIHGGPEGQFRPRFSSTFQYFVNELGMAVIAPNVRGSSGYGKRYLKLDNGRLREDSVRDIGALLDWVAARPELDASRVAVRGGSYGGYMSLASMIHFNDRLACGVDVVGISNFVTFLENTKPYRQDLRRPEYGDERDPAMREFLQAISPTARAAEITKPMFIAQGQNDPRVPASESEQMLAKIRSNGQDVWYFLAMDEGHGFRKKRNRDFYLSAQAYFLERCLVETTTISALP